MNLCLSIALLRSVHEGITQNLDPFQTPSKDKVAVTAVFPDVPANVKAFPEMKSAKDFRDVVFHCQWTPRDARLDVDEAVTKTLEALHTGIGQWLDTAFRSTHAAFTAKYDSPQYWVLSPDNPDWF